MTGLNSIKLEKKKKIYQQSPTKPGIITKDRSLNFQGNALVRTHLPFLSPPLTTAAGKMEGVANVYQGAVPGSCSETASNIWKSGL